jgi:hypothetical protein
MKHLPTSPHRKFFSAFTLAGIIFLATPGARAAELIMFEQAGCEWCAKFDREIAPIYPKTEEGQRAPLRRVNIDQPLPKDLAFIQVERLTPLFVMVDKGREVGRIRGYPGDDNFWGLLGVLIKRLDAPEAAGERTQLFGKTLRALD